MGSTGWYCLNFRVESSAEEQGAPTEGLLLLLSIGLFPHLAVAVSPVNEVAATVSKDTVDSHRGVRRKECSGKEVELKAAQIAQTDTMTVR